MTNPLGDGVDLRRLAHVLGAILLLVVVGLFVAATFPQLVGADQSYVVQSDSMSPAIKAGAVVFVSDVPTANIEEGHVVTYRAGGGQLVTHRVVDIQEGGDQRQFVTKGDANEDPDTSPVSEAEIVGRVGFHVPLMGYVISFAGTNLGILALVILPASLLIILEFRDFWRDATDDSPDWEGKL